MAKKKDEKDVLIVRDEKTGEISVVAGLNADGSPKRTPAKVENSQAFLLLQELLPAMQGAHPLRFLPHRGGAGGRAAGCDERTA